MSTNYITMHEKLGDWSESHKIMMEEYQLIDPVESAKYDSSVPGYVEKLQEELQR